MSDFVTRLERELHRAAVRREEAGALRGVALPRLRLALPGLVGGALAGAAVVVAVVALVVGFVASSPDRGAEGGVPAELRHAWRLPSKLVLKYTPATAELRFYPSGSKRCGDLGLGSGPCYAIDGKSTRALEWGTVSISEDRITFRAAQTHWCLPAGCNESGLSSTIDTPGVYGWTLRNGSLHLTPERDLAADRPELFGSGPLARVGLGAPPETVVPQGWTAKRFASARYGYSIRYPKRWSVLPAATSLPEGGFPLNTSRAVDKLARDPHGLVLPLLMIGAYDVAKSTTLEEFTARVSDSAGSSCPTSGRRRGTIGDEPAVVTLYPGCPSDAHYQWATVLHGGRGFQIVWSGAPGDATHDRPLFERLLRTFTFRR